MPDILAVGLGGFIGSICRYLIGLLPIETNSGFPVKTLAINIIGSFALGLLAAAAAKGRSLDPQLALMLRVGVCGGFTTFSTFAYEAADLIKGGQAMTALAYMILSMVLGVAAVFAAQMLVK